MMYACLELPIILNLFFLYIFFLVFFYLFFCPDDDCRKAVEKSAYLLLSILSGDNDLL